MKQNNGNKCRKVGLTGGIGAGKSTVAARLAMLGAHVLDADAISRAALDKDGACYAAVVEAFGPGVVKENGEIDRPAVSAVIFSDEAARRKLNAIVHPHVIDSLFTACGAIAAREENPIVVFDVPLLIECGLDREMDRNIVVVAEDAVRVTRICKRNGIGEDAARARMQSQISQQEQAQHADFVIDNSGDFATLYAAIDRVFAALQEEAGS